MNFKLASLAAVTASTLATSDASLYHHTRRSLGQAPEDCDDCYNETAGDGTVYYMYPQWLNNSRDYIYCEMLWNYGDPHGSDIRSTSPIAPCNLTWWDNLDLDEVAALRNASSATKNGPQYWSMDIVREYLPDPDDILGEPMVYGAVLPPGTVGNPQYTVFLPTKNQYLVWKAGLPTYRLTDADGYVYVLQGYKVDKDDLATLGSQFQELPEGWSYDVVFPTEDLIFDLTPDAPIPSVQDEFDQIYIRMPDGDAAPTQAPPTTSGGSSITMMDWISLGLSVISIMHGMWMM